jgi:hypothetical protein
MFYSIYAVKIQYHKQSALRRFQMSKKEPVKRITRHSIEITHDTHKLCSQLSNASGINRNRLIEFALHEWEQRHCTGNSIAARSLKFMREG